MGAGGLILPFSHNWDSFSKGMDQQGAYYECTFNFVGAGNWQYSDAIANQLKGLTTRVGGKTVFANTPFQHPLSSNLYCFDVRIEGIGSAVTNGNGFPNYDNGFLAHCTFRPWGMGGPFQQSDDPNNLQTIDGATTILWCTQEIDFETETITLANTNSQFLSDGKKTGTPITVEVAVTVLKLTFPRLPYMPSSAIRSLRGKINNGPFLGATTGTVRFRGGRTVRSFNTDGSCTQSVELVFIERHDDWNYALRRDTFVWDKVEDASGNNPYSYADLSPLIQL